MKVNYTVSTITKIADSDHSFVGQLTKNKSNSQVEYLIHVTNGKKLVLTLTGDEFTATAEYFGDAEPTLLTLKNPPITCPDSLLDYTIGVLEASYEY